MLKDIGFSLETIGEIIAEQIRVPKDLLWHMKCLMETEILRIKRGKSMGKLKLVWGSTNLIRKLWHSLIKHVNGYLRKTSKVTGNEEEYYCP